MKVIKTCEFVYQNPDVNYDYRESISIVQTYRGYQLLRDFKSVENGNTMCHAFLERKIMSLNEAEEYLNKVRTSAEFMEVKIKDDEQS